MREIVGPYDPTDKCKCTHPKIVSIHDYVSGWGRRVCDDCKKHYKWGVRDV